MTFQDAREREFGRLAAACKEVLSFLAEARYARDAMTEMMRVNELVERHKEMAAALDNLNRLNAAELEATRE